MRKSRYVLFVDNVSSSTRSKDIAYEFEACGKVRDVIRDPKYRCALVEMEKSSDADYAWKKMDGFKLDGRAWKVDYATRDDFKFFGWKWFEGSSPSPSRSRSPSKSPARSRSRSPSRGRSASPAAHRGPKTSAHTDEDNNTHDNKGGERSD